VKEGHGLVSVITRTCNRPELLEEALASVAAQDYPSIEHIVVNDGGSDVRALVERTRSHVKPRYFDPGRVGRCKAGNVGLEAAQGRWIAWLDDDDLYYPHHVSTLVKALRECGKLVVYSDADHVVQTWDPAAKAYREVSRTPTPSFEWSKITLWRRGDLHLVTVMHDRECTDRLGGFDESIPVLEDLDLLSRFAQEYNFFHVPLTTAVFRVRDDNTNAVTALRDEFAHVRSTFYKRYAHIVMPELLTMVEFGALELTVLKARVAELEARLARLEERPRP
jgi:glycosyltransferase involved in cell wall biosynthesis